MRLLIYKRNYIPEPTNIGRSTAEVDEWAVAEGQGREVRVVSALPCAALQEVEAGEDTLVTLGSVVREPSPPDLICGGTLSRCSLGAGETKV